MNVYIWGTGEKCKKILDTINKKDCIIIGFIDNNPDKKGKEFGNRRIYALNEIGSNYDYIVIAVANYDAIVYQLETNGYDMSKVIAFYGPECGKSEYEKVFDLKAWKIAVLEHKIERLETIINIRFDNIGYEIADKINKGSYRFPQIGDTGEAINKIIQEKCSLVRYGDGEFEIMDGKERLVYQDHHPELSRRLKEIIFAEDERLLIGIANNYGSLEDYAEDVADGIRMYMSREIRNYHLSALKQDKVYYDAYMFKAYYPFRDRRDTAMRISDIKKIWKDRDVVLIEGDKTRTGYGNDLFDNVKSLSRIIGPTRNAYDKYEAILKEGLKVNKDCLILVVMGPVANLLVYDFMREGYQAIDIGQIDMDYEWYLAGVGKKVPIPDKYVSQLPPAEIRNIKDETYLRQIIGRIQ